MTCARNVPQGELIVNANEKSCNPEISVSLEDDLLILKAKIFSLGDGIAVEEQED